MNKKVKEIINFIEKKRIWDLPIEVDKGNQVIPQSLKEIERYREFIKECPYLEHEHKMQANNIAERLIDAIQNFLVSDLEEANKNVKLIFSDEHKLEKQILKKEISKCINELDENLYKCRVVDEIELTKEDMFHIKFSERCKISNQRFSISGIPCLYLGTTTYVCWEELGRPILNTFWVSRYKLTQEGQNLRLLDISYMQDDIKRLEEKEDSKEAYQELVKYCISWIIQCLCTIRVKEKSRVFKEEFIIPQLVMQNLNKVNINGVMYYSTKCGQRKQFHGSYIMKNIALPAVDFKPNKKDGRIVTSDINKKMISDILKNAFEYSHPLNMGIACDIYSDKVANLDILNPEFLPRKEEFKRRNIDLKSYKLNMGADILENYTDSIFYKFQRYLDIKI